MASAGEQAGATYGLTAGATSLIKGYLPALDGWRAVSILLVLASHGGFGKIIPGGLGVTIFFFISGFLITSLLVNELQATNKISLRKFYLRRFWRLSPPLLIYIVAAAMFIIFIKGEINVQEILAATFYFANYYLLNWHFEPLPFGPSPLAILWSLAIEEHYYLFFAPLMLFFGNTPKKLFSILFILLVGPLLIRCYHVYGTGQVFINDSYTYMATEARIDSIAWGGVLAWVASRYSSDQVAKVLDAKFVVLLSAAILIICLVVRDERFRESTRYTMQGMALIAIFYSSVYGKTLRWSRLILTNRWVVLTGKLSYSIYLYHWLALGMASWLVGTEKLILNWLICYYGLTLVMALASYKLIEQPTLAIRKKFGSHASI